MIILKKKGGRLTTVSALSYKKILSYIILLGVLFLHIGYKKAFSYYIANLQDTNKRFSTQIIPVDKSFIKVFAVDKNSFTSLLYCFDIGLLSGIGIKYRLAEINFNQVISSLDIARYLNPKSVFPYAIVMYLLYDRYDTVNMTLNFLKKGVYDLPHNWEIPFRVGFISRIVKDDLEDAYKFYDIASKRAVLYGGPDWLKDLPAYMLLSLGKKRLALIYMKEALTHIQEENVKNFLEEKIKSLEKELINPL